MKFFIQNTYTSITGYTSQQQEFIQKLLTVRVPGYNYMAAYKRGNWDGCHHFYNKMTRSFPTGFLPYLLKRITQKKWYVECKDCRTQRFTSTESDYEADLRWYQIDAVNAILLGELQVGEQYIPWSRGIIKAPTGCHRAGQKILMYDGTKRSVEEIQVGELLMGSDSKPRRVLELCNGVGQMYRIKPVRGKSFVVNEDHVLTLVRTNEKKKYGNGGEIIDISVRDYLKKSKHFKHLHKLFHVPVDFRESSTDLPIDPYILGVILGDGSLSGHGVIVDKPDLSITRSLRAFATDMGMRFYKRGMKHSINGPGGGRKNKVAEILKSLGLWNILSGDKFIPFQYCVASREDRLQILAGLLDTDGSLGNNVYDFISKSYKLSGGVAYIARSLGLSVTSRIKYLNQEPYENTPYYRLCISGNIDLIPCRILRKKATSRLQKKDALRTGFSLEKLPTEEEYFGFRLSGDGRYLLDDFLVTHNSGKTPLAARLIQALNVPTLYLVESLDNMHQTQRVIQEWTGEPVGIVGDGIFKPEQITVCSLRTLMSRRKKLEGYFKNIRCLIVDECHRLGSNDYHKIVMSCPNAWARVGISATPLSRRDLGDCYLIGDCGDISYEVERKVLEDQGFLSRCRVVFLPVNIPVDHNAQYQTAYRELIVENTYRNRKIVWAAKKLLAKNRTVLILTKIVQHGKILQKLFEKESITSHFVSGKDSSGIRQSLLKGVGKNFKVLIANRIFDQSIDCPVLDDLIIAAGGDSVVNTIQRVGRVLRPKTHGENYATIVDFVDKTNKHLIKHSEHRLATYNGEGFAVKVIG